MNLSVTTSKCGCFASFQDKHLNSDTSTTWIKAHVNTSKDHTDPHLYIFTHAESSRPMVQFEIHSSCTPCQRTNIAITQRHASKVVSSSSNDTAHPEIDGITYTTIEGRECIGIDTSRFDITKSVQYVSNESESDRVILLSIKARTVTTAEKPESSTTASKHTSTAAPQSTENESQFESIKSWLKTYQAVVVIVFTSMLTTHFMPLDGMDSFMGMYMTLFAFLQLCDINTTAAKLGRYDIIVKNFKIMGYLLPVINLFLGLWHFNGTSSIIRSVSTGLIATAKSIGPFNAMRSTEKVDCGCVGSVGNMKVGLVTFLEEAVMIFLCAVQLNTLINNHSERAA